MPVVAAFSEYLMFLLTAIVNKEQVLQFIFWWNPYPWGFNRSEISFIENTKTNPGGCWYSFKALVWYNRRLNPCPLLHTVFGLYATKPLMQLNCTSTVAGLKTEYICWVHDIMTFLTHLTLNLWTVNLSGIIIIEISVSDYTSNNQYDNYTRRLLLPILFISHEKNIIKF